MFYSKGHKCQVVPVLELESKPGTFPQIYSQEESAFIPAFTGQGTNSLTLKSETQLEKERLQKAKNAEKLKEVEQQQEEFGRKEIITSLFEKGSNFTVTAFIREQTSVAPEITKKNFFINRFYITTRHPGNLFY